MILHKRTRLTPENRKQIWTEWQTGNWSKSALQRKWNVTWPTIHKVILRARGREFQPRLSINAKFRALPFGVRRLAKIEKHLEEKLRNEARRYNKKYPGEMVHFDTKRLPLLTGEHGTLPREYLFVAIDDFSRELFAAILPDKSAPSARTFLEQVINECAYTMECAYSDNGTEYRGTSDHPFASLCIEKKISQRFTRVKRPQTNGKAERVIRTLMEMWHRKTIFTSRSHRHQELKRFINWYNGVKPHASLNNSTPEEILLNYFYPSKL